MKKRLLKGFGALSLFAFLMLLMSSCAGDSYWYDDGDFYDHRLDGRWELVQYDSNPVYDDAVNYLYFDGRGRGTYWYYRGGRLYSMPTYYESQPSYSGISDYQLNLQYGNDRPTTISYWFTAGNNTLWMQWREGGRVVTYVYDRVNYFPF